MKYLFPFTVVAMMACASIPYFCEGDWRRGVYWLAAATINFVVTI